MGFWQLGTKRNTGGERRSLTELLAWLKADLKLELSASDLELWVREQVEWPATDNPQQEVIIHYLPEGLGGGAALERPVPYGFPGLRTDGMPEEDIVSIFRGWHICFHLIRQTYYPEEKQTEDWPAFEAELRQAGMENVVMKEAIRIGPHNYYSVSAVRQGTPVILIGTRANYFAFDPDQPAMQRPLYFFIGASTAEGEAEEQ
jgi:hypothetical protein